MSFSVQPYNAPAYRLDNSHSMQVLDDNNDGVADQVVHNINVGGTSIPGAGILGLPDIPAIGGTQYTATAKNNTAHDWGKGAQLEIVDKTNHKTVGTYTFDGTQYVDAGGKVVKDLALPGAKGSDNKDARLELEGGGGFDISWKGNNPANRDNIHQSLWGNEVGVHTQIGNDEKHVDFGSPLAADGGLHKVPASHNLEGSLSADHKNGSLSFDANNGKHYTLDMQNIGTADQRYALTEQDTDGKAKVVAEYKGTDLKPQNGSPALTQDYYGNYFDVPGLDGALSVSLPGEKNPSLSIVGTAIENKDVSNGLPGAVKFDVDTGHVVEYENSNRDGSHAEAVFVTSPEDAQKIQDAEKQKADDAAKKKADEGFQWNDLWPGNWFD